MSQRPWLGPIRFSCLLPIPTLAIIRRMVIRAERNIQLFLGWHTFRAQVKRVTSRASMRKTPHNKELRFAAPVFIDCTGTGGVGFLAGAGHRLGREAKSSSMRALPRNRNRRQTTQPRRHCGLFDPAGHAPRGHIDGLHPRLNEFGERVPDSPASQRMASLAKQLRCFISFGLSERDGDRFYITQVFCGPEGFVYRYRKAWLWREEKDEGYRNEHARYDPGPGPERFAIDGIVGSPTN